MKRRLRAPAQCLALCALAVVAVAHVGDAANAADAGDAGETPNVTPYRPTVSDPAALSAPGWVELESGVSAVRDPDATRTWRAPYLLKYAFDADHGLLLGGDAWIDQHAAHAVSMHSVGDTFLAWKQRFALDDAHAFGIEAAAIAPSADAALGEGKPAYRATGIYSADLGATHVDLNLGGTRFTRRSAHAARWEGDWSAAVSHPLDDAFGATAELSGSARRGADHAHQALGAITYNLDRRCVLDAGLAFGLDRSGHSREVFFGATWLVGRVR